MILLDTHVVIWLFNGDPRLRPTALGTIEAARDTVAVRVSPITFWEAATLVRKNRIHLPQPLLVWMKRVVTAQGIQTADITADIAGDAGSLNTVHGDPADRFLIATARTLDCPLQTAHEAILRHAGAGLLKAIDARR